MSSGVQEGQAEHHGPRRTLSTRKSSRLSDVNSDRVIGFPCQKLRQGLSNFPLPRSPRWRDGGMMKGFGQQAKALELRAALSLSRLW